MRENTEVWTEACFSGPEIQKALFSQSKKLEATWNIWEWGENREVVVQPLKRLVYNYVKQ